MVAPIARDGVRWSKVKQTRVLSVCFLYSVLVGYMQLSLTGLGGRVKQTRVP